ncbi:MAG: hypothetical protein H6Q07_2268 [Acidobacteria bacterium]|nr:hypothetical protein [Acidobacteriota bacterium]
MDQPMINDIQKKLTAIFDQVSAPLYHKGEGPFFMATHEFGNDVKFFFYEANDVETFLVDPEKMPAAFSEADFLFSATDDLDMAKIEHTNRDYALYQIRLVPDSASCRHVIQQLHATNPDQVLNIALIDEEGKIIPAVQVLNTPVLLM